MDLLDSIGAALRREVVAGRLTEQDAAGLRERCGCLAFNMTAAGKQGPVPERAAAYWLFHVRWRKLTLLPTASAGELERAGPMLRLGEAAGFLRVVEDDLRFVTPPWQAAFCVDFVRARPLQPRLFRLMSRPSFREVWRLWAQVRPEVADEVVALLRTSTNRIVRRRSATILSWLATPGLVAPLIDALHDPSRGVRIAAAQALGAIGDPHAIPPLIDLVRTHDTPVQADLVETMLRFGAPAVPPLIALLADDEPNVRSWAAGVLARLGDPRAVEPLIGWLRRERDDGARKAAFAALARLRAPAAVPTLVEALSEPAWRWHAARALGAIGDPRAVPPLLAALADRAPDAAYAPNVEDAVRISYAAQAARRAIGSALVTLAQADMFDLFLHALRKGTPDVRPWAAAALARIGGRDARDALVTALRDPLPAVRAAAAEALGRHVERPDIKVLIAALHDKDVAVRANAATALGHLGGERVVTALIAALRDAHVTVRQIAARALGELGDRRAVEPLIRALADPASPRADIIQALGALGDSRAVAPLIALLESPDVIRDVYTAGAVVHHALRVLAELGGERAVEPLLRVLEEPFPDADAPALSVGQYWFRRKTAAEALAKLGDPRAVEPLIAALADSDSGPERGPHQLASVAVAEALGQIGAPRAIRALARVQRPRSPGDYTGRLLNRAAAHAFRRIREQRRGRSG